jgi:trimeric autotransporter adhesin
MANIYGDGADNTLNGGIEDDSIYGYAGSDHLWGAGGDDKLFGGEGDDYLFGSAGKDTLKGGAGNDYYYVSYSVASEFDAIVEYRGEGIDTVAATMNYTLGNNLENLSLSGTAIEGTGNWQDNTIYGNGSNNKLWGMDGDDYLHGGAGLDTLYGGDGNDWLSGDAGADLMIGGAGDDDYIIDDQGDKITEISGEGSLDEARAKVSYKLDANVERLFLLDEGGSINGTGNELSNTIVGNASNNILSGGDGDDSIHAGGGIDTLYGDDGNDWLYGSGSVTTMYGGIGNDTYRIDGNDTVIETAAGGLGDEVQAGLSYTLTANVERLWLLEGGAYDGSGNDSDNNIYGNSSANTLTGGLGNDTLDGKGGVDILIGGFGIDSYYVDNVGDQVLESAGEGIDYVYSSVTFTLGANIENLNLNGSQAAINGTGNAENNIISGNSAANILTGNGGMDWLYGGGDNDTLNGGSGVDLLYGEAGADTLNGGLDGDLLDGGTGADTMAGGLGNDTYVVDEAGDVVIENAGEGLDDVVESSISFELNLTPNVENLSLTGSANIDGYGNALNNVLYGNGGNNSFAGWGGADTFYGGAGTDWVVYTPSSAGVVVSLATGMGSGGDAQGDALFDIENLFGSAYDDTLTGNGGNNVLNGYNGADTLIGGLGVDTFLGGADADTFVFTAINESAVAMPDQILDFATAQGDKIDLSQIDAIMGGGGANDIFNFIGNAAFSGSAGELHFLNGLVEADVNGDGAADFAIQVNQASLAASDFIL